MNLCSSPPLCGACEDFIRRIIFVRHEAVTSLDLLFPFFVEHQAYIIRRVKWTSHVRINNNEIMFELWRQSHVLLYTVHARCLLPQLDGGALTSLHVQNVQCVWAVFINDRTTVNAKVLQMVFLDAQRWLDGVVRSRLPQREVHILIEID